MGLMIETVTDQRIKFAANLPPPAVETVHIFPQNRMMTIAVPAHQQLHGEHGEGSSSSCCKIGAYRRTSSAPSQEQHTARITAMPAARQSPVFLQHRRHKLPSTVPKTKQNAALRPATLATGKSTVSTTADGCDAPLNFPVPKFSSAAKVASDGEGFILVSQTTGRRWVAFSSTRKCQFGEVLRAVELTEEMTDDPPMCFAIKV